MEKVNFYDSDLQIIENEQSIISITESEDSFLLKKNATVIVLDDTINEEGEVVENNADQLLFKVNFENSNAFFHSNAAFIAETLVNACQTIKTPIKYEISTEHLCILAYSDATELAATQSKESSPDLTGIKELFTIDPSPSEKPEIIQVPSYKRSIKNVLDEESLQNKRIREEGVCQRARPSALCFNCGVSGHALRDCPKKRNGRRIQKARSKFMSSAEQRYHAKVEDRYPHLRAGVISESLRKALNMRTGEIPFFYYRMRVLGYPPGWLEEAKVQPSGLALISADGSKIGLENDGKTDIDNAEKYDTSKIIDFPGFNLRPNKNFYDDYKHHNVPPLQKNDLKEEFIKRLGSNVVKGYKRRKISNLPQNSDEVNTVNDESRCLEPADMEIEDVPETTETTINDKSTDMSTLNETNATSSRSPSPTLAALEAQQNALLEALNSSNKNLILSEEKTTANDDENNTNLSDDNTVEIKTTNDTNDIKLKLVINETENATKVMISTPIIIKESYMGTPLLKFSPFDKLPSGDNFKVGVSDVINFENLPDSTGKYEQMKFVIKKVRNIVTQLNSEEAD